MFNEEMTTQLREVTRASSQEFMISFTLGSYWSLCSLRRLSAYGIHSPLRSVYSGETSEGPWSYVAVSEERKSKPS